MSNSNTLPTVYEMDDETVARWCCLVEAIKTINRTADRLGIDCDRTTSWIKPGAIQRFIQEEFPVKVDEIRAEREVSIMLGFQSN